MSTARSDELAATGVDVIAYCDMVTTFIMAPGWNEDQGRSHRAATSTPAISAWTALRDALGHLGITRFALGTPYPTAIHAMTMPFFTACGYNVVSDATLDVVQMRDVPKISAAEAERICRQHLAAGRAGHRAARDRPAEFRGDRRPRDRKSACRF